MFLSVSCGFVDKFFSPTYAEPTLISSSTPQRGQRSVRREASFQRASACADRRGSRSSDSPSRKKRGSAGGLGEESASEVAPDAPAAPRQRLHAQP